MMRDIKFRAWDINEKIMVYNVQVPEIELTIKIPNRVTIKRERKIMQRTWLKDNNWKEIFEGDILRYKNVKLNHKPRIIEWQESKSRFSVKKIPYDIDNQSNDRMPKQKTLQKNWEVIWNIYENPDLLNNKE